ncbi:MAG: phage head closure protein [Ruminococcus sp.]|nr:phage head closure protein [Ruminococcus sp.]MCM1381315.1 phage head closure protein [Muribaculaceae bacterium]MCM1480340.1 phage head closure protein [Muribaculaceae bacterium]
MKISKFNQKISFQKSEIFSDKIGNRRNIWNDFYSCYAYVSCEGGKEKTTAGMVTADFDLAFSVRFCKVLSNVNSVNCRIVFRSEIYNIESVDHMNFGGKTIKFKCRKERENLCQTKQ